MMQLQRDGGFIGAVLAMVLLAIPAIATFVDILRGPDDIRSEQVARTPTLNAGLLHFVADTRIYIKERFAAKDQLVTLNSLVKTEVFASMPYANVISGEDGFLFLSNAETIDYHQRIRLFAADELASWRRGFMDASARLAARNVRYHVFIAPNKDAVYPDKLPLWVNRHWHHQSRLDQLSDALQGTTVGITYPLAAIQRAVENFPQADPFFKTDTHWNEFGAGVAAVDLLQDLGLPVADRLHPEPYSPDRAGDLARMIGQQKRMLESGWTLPDALLAANCVRDDGNPFVRRQTDLYKFNTVHCTGGKPNGLKALIFMDSFGVGLVPYLGTAFAEVMFVWSYKLDEALVEQIRPDFVIHQMVERKLQTLSINELFARP